MRSWMIRALGTAGLALVTLAGCASKDVVIGALVSESGAQGVASDGVQVVQGMRLAVDLINDEGGLNGRRLVLNAQDVASDPQKAVDAFNRMEADVKPLVYVSTLSSVALALAPVAEQNGAPLLATESAATGLTTGKKYIFRFWPSAEDQTAPMLRLLDIIRPRRVTMFYPDEAFGQSFYNEYAPALAAKGVEVMPVVFSSSETAYGRYMTGLAASDTTIISGYQANVEGLLSAIKATGYNGRLVTTSAASVPEVIARPATDGVYMLATSLYNSNNARARRFVSLYQERYGAVATHFAGAGYDIVNLIEQLLEDATVSRDSLAQILGAGFVFSGVNGQVQVPVGQHEFAFPYLPARAVNGRLQYM